jgi:transposase-like protein
MRFDKKCPACNRKGLHYAMHPHAFGWKDTSRLECRFCHKTFKIKEPPPQENVR